MYRTETKDKNILKTIKELDNILDDIWCTYSFEKGTKKWREFAKNIPSEFENRISTEIGHVYCGHGIIQARLAVKSEMSAYIEYLINNR